MPGGRPSGKPQTASGIGPNFFLEMPGSRHIAPENISYNSNELLEHYNLTLNKGDCDRGVIVFKTPANQKPLSVVFSSSSTIKWAV
jgi:hypothetical protein